MVFKECGLNLENIEEVLHAINRGNVIRLMYLKWYCDGWIRRSESKETAGKVINFEVYMTFDVEMQRAWKGRNMNDNKF